MASTIPVGPPPTTTTSALLGSMSSPKVNVCWQPIVCKLTFTVRAMLTGNNVSRYTPGAGDGETDPSTALGTIEGDDPGGGAPPVRRARLSSNDDPRGG